MTLGATVKEERAVGELLDWANDLWAIILTLDKSVKQYLKDEAQAKRSKAREKCKQKKAKKKIHRRAHKEATKRVKSHYDLLSMSTDQSDSDDSSESSSSTTDLAPRRSTGS